MMGRDRSHALRGPHANRPDEGSRVHRVRLRTARATIGCGLHGRAARSAPSADCAARSARIVPRFRRPRRPPIPAGQAAAEPAILTNRSSAEPARMTVPPQGSCRPRAGEGSIRSGRRQRETRCAAATRRGRRSHAPASRRRGALLVPATAARRGRPGGPQAARRSSSRIVSIPAVSGAPVFRLGWPAGPVGSTGRLGSSNPNSPPRSLHRRADVSSIRRKAPWVPDIGSPAVKGRCRRQDDHLAAGCRGDLTGDRRRFKRPSAWALGCVWNCASDCASWGA
jgi:hypothetical protein